MGPDKLALIVVGAAMAASGMFLGLRLRRRKSAADKERERRLLVNTIGRICDGSIERFTESDADAGPVRLLHYTYSVRGVSYSAAQDVSHITQHVRAEHLSEGVPASVKYDPQNPTNSIVVCELWSGLRNWHPDQ
jgi:hypothetical protein